MMLHFAANPECSALKRDKDPRNSSLQSLDWFRTWHRTNTNLYCAECAASRDDSERYAELRKLVEAFQNAKSGEDDAPLQALRDWSHR